MKANEAYESGYARQVIPESGQTIEIHDDFGEVKSVTWVDDNLGYSMNGCFKVRDTDGQVRLIAPSRKGRIVPRWRSV